MSDAWPLVKILGIQSGQDFSASPCVLVEVSMHAVSLKERKKTFLSQDQM